MIRWTPRFVFNDGEAHDVTLLLPVGLWRHTVPTVGGDIESDAGHPASYVVSRTYALTMALRFYESEWPAVRALLEFGQLGGPVTWYPDADEPASVFDVYLDGPEVGTEIAPEPDETYPRALSLTIVLSQVDGTPFDALEYFSEAA